ncbi:major facilitator superfamily domain-containing protein [Mucor lusitanicus]|uniref:Major facilitator superfamily domain-containing protein n=1 Tax=Mucor circinelloides f. lusitanicus TaxID=29924 RepID=A0A8H4EZC9_MUCCL|nr:major facilitator superfamily domain-containing protein [Mucor lusitanicus]
MDDKATKVIDKSTDDFTTQDHASSIIIHSTGTADQVSRNDSTLLKKLLFKLKGDIYATDDPRQYSPARKKFIVFIVALGGIYGPLSTLIYLPGILQMARDLNASIEAINATMSAYVALAGLTPLFWSSISDTYGRRPVYMMSISIGIVASILCASSNNIAMLIVFRALQASGASSGQTLGAGSIGDVFDIADRGKAYGVFFIGPLLGPSLGTLIGGFLCEFLGWQSTFYFTAIFGGVVLVLVAFFLPETVRKTRPAVQKGKGSSVFKNLRVAFAPMIVMLGDPTILIMTLYGSIIFASLFFLNPTITDTFQTLYNYNSWQVGLCYLCLGVGMICGSVLSGIYSDRIIRDLRNRRGSENVYPELRLKAVYPSFILIPAGFLIYAWTTEKHVAAYGPLIGLFVYAVGQMFAVNPSSVYYVDSKPGRSASAVSLNNCARSLLGAIVTIFSTSCVRSAGPGIVFTVLAAISVVNIVFVLLVKVYGRKWRTAFEEKTGTAPAAVKNTVHSDSSLVDESIQEKA